LDHIQIRDTGKKYYFPEEPLTPLVGQPAHGPWTLEVWDSRLGALMSNSELVSWRLNLAYVRTNPPATRLTNGVPYVGSVFSNNLQYFVVNVPCTPARVTHTLTSLTPPGRLDLLFNQDTFPTGSEPGDFVLLANTLGGSAVLNVGTYPLARRGAYILAVRNSNPVQNNNFRLRVDIDCNPSFSPLGPFAIPQTISFGPDGFTLTWVSDPGAEFEVQYAEDPTGPWMAFPQTMAAPNGEFSFTDDGSASGGLSLNRFYRLLRLQ
ncbi:MAG TPA: hypothetical protein VNT99_18555, partial [Methylomirabilota bacterium]|nr:hypothetical protein [Methylomirabilota bacterium]